MCSGAQGRLAPSDARKGRFRPRTGKRFGGTLEHSQSAVFETVFWLTVWACAVIPTVSHVTYVSQKSPVPAALCSG